MKREPVFSGRAVTGAVAALGLLALVMVVWTALA